MKVRLQDIVKHCVVTEYCHKCKYYKNGECMVSIDGCMPAYFEEYVNLCGNLPELAKLLYTNEEVELNENDTERTY